LGPITTFCSRSGKLAYVAGFSGMGGVIGPMTSGTTPGPQLALFSVPHKVSDGGVFDPTSGPFQPVLRR
jgi:hypothetical protein